MWYSNFCAAKANCSIAVTDTACVTNPKRPGTREIVKTVGTDAVRSAKWKAIAQKNHQKTGFPKLSDFHRRQ